MSFVYVYIRFKVKNQVEFMNYGNYQWKYTILHSYKNIKIVPRFCLFLLSVTKQLLTEKVNNLFLIQGTQSHRRANQFLLRKNFTDIFKFLCDDSVL